jgi:NAD(P) transhydrogenase
VTTKSGNERALCSRRVLIATGSSPFHPPGIPFDDPDVHDSQTMLEIDRPFTNLVVVGGGPVGREYASIFAALGVEVTLVDAGERLLPFANAEVARLLAEIFPELGYLAGEDRANLLARRVARHRRRGRDSNPRSAE